MLILSQCLPSNQAIVSWLENLPQPVASESYILSEERISQVKITSRRPVGNYDN